MDEAPKFRRRTFVMVSTKSHIDQWMARMLQNPLVRVSSAPKEVESGRWHVALERRRKTGKNATKAPH